MLCARGTCISSAICAFANFSVGRMIGQRLSLLFHSSLLYVLAALLRIGLNNSLKFPKLFLSMSFSFVCDVLFICGAVSALSSPDFFAYVFFKNIKLFIFRGMKWKAWFSCSTVFSFTMVLRFGRVCKNNLQNLLHET